MSDEPFQVANLRDDVAWCIGLVADAYALTLAVHARTPEADEGKPGLGVAVSRLEVAVKALGKIATSPHLPSLIPILGSIS